MKENLNSNNSSADKSALTDAQQIKELILYIENSPEFAHLVEKAKNPQLSQQQNNNKRLIKKILGLVIADPKDFHGRAIVSDNLAKASERTACLVSISSAVNAATSFPLLLYAFSNLGLLAVPATLFVSGLILKYTNEAAAAVSARQTNGRTWSNWAIGATIAINFVSRWS